MCIRSVFKYCQLRYSFSHGEQALCMHIFHSDDDLLDGKHLDPIFEQLFILSFIF